MDISKLNFRSLWVETSTGEIGEVDLRDGSSPSPETHPIAVSRFPLEVRTTYYRRREDGGYGGKDEIFTGNSTTNSQDLLIAIALGYNPEALWWERRIYRRTRYSLHDAMIIVSASCERCLNAIAHRYGLKWGYPEFSDAWKRANTCCIMCRHLCLRQNCCQITAGETTLQGLLT